MAKQTVKKRSSVILKVTFALFLLAASVSLLKLQNQIDVLAAEAEALKSEIAAKRLSIEELKAILNSPFDEEYIEKVAKRKFNFHLPQEILIYNDVVD